MAERPTKENQEKPKRARITLECSLETRISIKIMAAKKNKSMNDFILSTLLEKSKRESDD